MSGRLRQEQIRMKRRCAAKGCRRVARARGAFCSDRCAARERKRLQRQRPLLPAPIARSRISDADVEVLGNDAVTMTPQQRTAARRRFAIERRLRDRVTDAQARRYDEMKVQIRDVEPDAIVVELFGVEAGFPVRKDVAEAWLARRA